MANLLFWPLVKLLLLLLPYLLLASATSDHLAFKPNMFPMLGRAARFLGNGNAEAPSPAVASNHREANGEEPPPSESELVIRDLGISAEEAKKRGYTIEDDNIKCILARATISKIESTITPPDGDGRAVGKGKLKIQSNVIQVGDKFYENGGKTINAYKFHQPVVGPGLPMKWCSIDKTQDANSPDDWKEVVSLEDSPATLQKEWDTPAIPLDHWKTQSFQALISQKYLFNFAIVGDPWLKKKQLKAVADIGKKGRARRPRLPANSGTRAPPPPPPTPVGGNHNREHNLSSVIAPSPLPAAAFPPQQAMPTPSRHGLLLDPATPLTHHETTRLLNTLERMAQSTQDQAQSGFSLARSVETMSHSMETMAHSIQNMTGSNASLASTNERLSEVLLARPSAIAAAAVARHEPANESTDESEEASDDDDDDDDDDDLEDSKPPAKTDAKLVATKKSSMTSAQKAPTSKKAPGGDSDTELAPRKSLKRKAPPSSSSKNTKKAPASSMKKEKAPASNKKKAPATWKPEIDDFVQVISVEHKGVVGRITGFATRSIIEVSVDGYDDPLRKKFSSLKKLY